MATTTTAIEKKREPTAIEQIGQMLEERKSKLAKVLPKHISADRLVRVALLAMARNPDLLLCTQASIAIAVEQAAQYGLEPGGPLGDAYLVPYRNNKLAEKAKREGRGPTHECQLILGYQGMISLARRSGEIAKIESRIVRAVDEFDYQYGDAPYLRHKPAPGDDEERGELVGAYAVATLRDGTKQFEVMTYQQLTKIRDRSRASDNGPWRTDFEEMARKTVVRRLFKYLPKSVDMRTQLDREDNAEAGIFEDASGGEIIDGSIVEQRNTLSSIVEAEKKKARGTKSESRGKVADMPASETVIDTRDHAPNCATRAPDPGPCTCSDDDGDVAA